jgi:hypothetical protein
VNTHEDFTRKEEIKGPSDRSFGWVFTVAFAVIALLPLWRHGPLRVWALAISAAMAIITLLKPALLHSANRLWARFGLLLNKIVSPVVTSLLFYLVVTPIGLLMRLFGQDPLRLRFDRQSVSYWIERTPPGPAPDSMSHQF